MMFYFTKTKSIIERNFEKQKGKEFGKAGR